MFSSIYLINGWQIWAASIDGVGRTREVRTVVRRGIVPPCYAVHHDHRQIRMTGLDIETVSLLNSLKQ